MNSSQTDTLSSIRQSAPEGMLSATASTAHTKFVVVTGGVISGVGKGIIASSMGVLLKGMGFHVSAIKIDPYLNIDAGTLSPFDHGEVYTLEDGGEVDLDLGNYERFMDIQLTQDHNITTGKVYSQVIEKERRGDYLGKTVQVVPHLTNAIQDWVERVSRIPVDAAGGQPEVCIVELGGTVGDIESAPFVEALRQFQFRVGIQNFCLVHVSLVPSVGSSGEQKTKPTQASVRDLRGLGLSPDIVACRSKLPLEAGVSEKIAMFCHVAPSEVLSQFHVVGRCRARLLQRYARAAAAAVAGAGQVPAAPPGSSPEDARRLCVPVERDSPPVAHRAPSFL